MCGIFGFVAKKRGIFTEATLRSSLSVLVKLSERRGNEAAGLVSISDDSVNVYKQAMKPSRLIKTPQYSEFITSSFSPGGSEGTDSRKPFAVFGHARLVTNGSQALHENNQPVRSGNVIGVHNGIVTNDKELVGHFQDMRDPLNIYSDSDTEVLLALIDKCYKQNGQKNIAAAIAKAYKKIAGAASIALFCDTLPMLIVATNTGSLYYSQQEEQGFFVFGSERRIVEGFLNKNGMRQKFHKKNVVQLKSFSCALISFEHAKAEVYPFKKVSEKKDQSSPLSNKAACKMFDIGYHEEDMRRCTKCVLPESFPFISFDIEGVCNYCRRYQTQKYQGTEAIERILDTYRSKNGEPDCIIGFSGGRDSSYGLHLLKKQFGMHPVAFTYDWGMVTDLARRNQAKVTGNLGVEHVIVSADIHKKRKYIRKNIFAWLRKPELGMVPLFMAGDKMFYYYGKKLRKELGVKLTVFACGYQLEQMEFKIGFCGIDQPLVNNQKMYYYNTLVKVRMAIYYLTQYITNPAYINESFFDSVFSYYSSFVNKDDYLYLFNYIPWEEEKIHRVLRDEYDWEVDSKFGKNQWRMGDGHTAFIDYIYHTVAGFSEFDNFRSNQIREGLITRDEALEMVREDNKPRIAMLKDFSQMIGFNLEEVLIKINNIPKLYKRTRSIKKFL